MPKEKQANVTEASVTLTLEKECGKVHKFSTDADDAVVSNVYVSKSIFKGKPKGVKITVVPIYD